MKTVGMGSAEKSAGDNRTESAVKKENTLLKRANAELAAQVEALTAKVTELKAASGKAE